MILAPDTALPHLCSHGRSSVGTVYLFGTTIDPNNNDDEAPTPSSSSSWTDGMAESSTTSGNENQEMPGAMANVYQEWTVEQDQYLIDHEHKSITDLAAHLGRGLRGVETRLGKLKDVNSPAYERLFVTPKNNNDASDNDNDDGDTVFVEKKEKLVPAKEVLRRIQWDYTLQEQDFSILHYDRVDESVVETGMDTPNTSIGGREEKMVFALPEHRIMAVKYKERIVWDKEARIDRVFGSAKGNGETIDVVLEGYDDWKQRQDAAREWNRQRQKQVSSRIETVLGPTRFDAFKTLSSKLMKDSIDSETTKDGIVPRQETERYVQSCLKLFREARSEVPVGAEDVHVAALTDLEALELFSELVALLPNSQLRPSILEEISNVMVSIDSTNRNNNNNNNSNTNETGSNRKNHVLPDLNEDDLIETFVRGSGAGGQKINKTANRVVLLHEPTQLRVECQDTRSLQQNRKIARKRLRLKLDEYINGSQSRVAVKANKAVSKKAKAKARNKARQRKKKEAKTD